METNPRFEALQLAATPDIGISGILGIPEWWPSGHRIGVVMAHDVGGNMDQELVVWLQHQLVDRGFLTIRFNFPYAEQGKKRPDPPVLLEKAYRAAIAGLVRDPQDTPAQTVFAGVGLGARVSADIIASGAKADALLTLAYPLHPAGKPSQQRADSLFRIICPILFVQGTRDSHCRSAAHRGPHDAGRDRRCRSQPGARQTRDPHRGRDPGPGARLDPDLPPALHRRTPLRRPPITR